MFHTPAHKVVTTPAATAKASRDFRAEDHGSIVLLVPMTAAAKSWCAENLPEDCATFGSGFAIEPRHFADIRAGILDSDLTI